MTRRGLIGALLGAATMDPERLLWVPGTKVISIPKPVVQVYGNQFLTIEMMGHEVLRVLQTQLEVHQYNSESFRSDWKLGDTVRVKMPERFRG